MNSSDVVVRQVEFAKWESGDICKRTYGNFHQLVVGNVKRFKVIANEKAVRETSQKIWRQVNDSQVAHVPESFRRNFSQFVFGKIDDLNLSWPSECVGRNEFDEIVWQIKNLEFYEVSKDITASVLLKFCKLIKIFTLTTIVFTIKVLWARFKLISESSAGLKNPEFILEMLLCERSRFAMFEW